MPQHRDSRAESGAIGVGTVIGVALAVLAVYLLIGATEGDSAHYGRAPVPSTTRIELPKGETDVFYAEKRKAAAGDPLSVPGDLDYLITDSAGQGVKVSSRGGDPEETDDGTARVVGAVSAPADGVYTLEVTSNEAAQRVGPELTFGQSPFQAVADRFDKVVEELKGPTGIVVAIVLLVLFLLPSFQRAARRRGGD